jgi:hypothetical protein
MAEDVILDTRIGEVTGSNLDLRTGYPDLLFFLLLLVG